MTKDEILSMAKESGFMRLTASVNGQRDWWECFDEELERFAALVAEKEREACARVCDALHYEVDAYGAQCAAAIRNRGNP
jgi:hypothetical protein